MGVVGVWPVLMESSCRVRMVTQEEQSWQTDWKRSPLALRLGFHLQNCTLRVHPRASVQHVTCRSHFSPFVTWALGLKRGSPA